MEKDYFGLTYRDAEHQKVPNAFELALVAGCFSLSITLVSYFLFVVSFQNWMDPAKELKKQIRSMSSHVFVCF